VWALSRGGLFRATSQGEVPLANPNTDCGFDSFNLAINPCFNRGDRVFSNVRANVGAVELQVVSLLRRTFVLRWDAIEQGGTFEMAKRVLFNHRWNILSSRPGMAPAEAENQGGEEPELGLRNTCERIFLKLDIRSQACA
jgi:hypothetical protein